MRTQAKQRSSRLKNDDDAHDHDDEPIHRYSVLPTPKAVTNTTATTLTNIRHRSASTGSAVSAVSSARGGRSGDTAIHYKATENDGKRANASTLLALSRSTATKKSSSVIQPEELFADSTPLSRLAAEISADGDEQRVRANDDGMRGRGGYREVAKGNAYIAADNSSTGGAQTATARGGGTTGKSNSSNSRPTSARRLVKDIRVAIPHNLSASGELLHTRFATPDTTASRRGGRSSSANGASASPSPTRRGHTSSGGSDEYLSRALTVPTLHAIGGAVYSTKPATAATLFTCTHHSYNQQRYGQHSAARRKAEREREPVGDGIVDTPSRAHPLSPPRSREDDSRRIGRYSEEGTNAQRGGGGVGVGPLKPLVNPLAPSPATIATSASVFLKDRDLIVGGDRKKTSNQRKEGDKSTVSSSTSASRPLALTRVTSPSHDELTFIRSNGLGAVDSNTCFYFDAKPSVQTSSHKSIIPLPRCWLCEVPLKALGWGVGMPKVLKAARLHPNKALSTEDNGASSGPDGKTRHSRDAKQRDVSLIGGGVQVRNAEGARLFPLSLLTLCPYCCEGVSLPADATAAEVVNKGQDTFACRSRSVPFIGFLREYKLLLEVLALEAEAEMGLLEHTDKGNADKHGLGGKSVSGAHKGTSEYQLGARDVDGSFYESDRESAGGEKRVGTPSLVRNGYAAQTAQSRKVLQAQEERARSGAKRKDTTSSGKSAPSATEATDSPAFRALRACVPDHLLVPILEQLLHCVVDALQVVSKVNERVIILDELAFLDPSLAPAVRREVVSLARAANALSNKGRTSIDSQSWAGLRSSPQRQLSSPSRVGANQLMMALSQHRSAVPPVAHSFALNNTNNTNMTANFSLPAASPIVPAARRSSCEMRSDNFVTVDKNYSHSHAYSHSSRVATANTKKAIVGDDHTLIAAADMLSVTVAKDGRRRAREEQANRHPPPSSRDAKGDPRTTSSSNAYEHSEKEKRASNLHRRIRSGGTRVSPSRSLSPSATLSSPSDSEDEKKSVKRQNNELIILEQKGKQIEEQYAKLVGKTDSGALRRSRSPAQPYSRHKENNRTPPSPSPPQNSTPSPHRVRGSRERSGARWWEEDPTQSRSPLKSPHVDARPSIGGGGRSGYHYNCVCSAKADVERMVARNAQLEDRLASATLLMDKQRMKTEALGRANVELTNGMKKLQKQLQQQQHQQPDKASIPMETEVSNEGSNVRDVGDAMDSKKGSSAALSPTSQAPYHYSDLQRKALSAHLGLANHILSENASLMAYYLHKKYKMLYQELSRFVGSSRAYEGEDSTNGADTQAHSTCGANSDSNKGSCRSHQSDLSNQKRSAPVTQAKPPRKGAIDESLMSKGIVAATSKKAEIANDKDVLMAYSTSDAVFLEGAAEEHNQKKDVSAPARSAGPRVATTGRGHFISEFGKEVESENEHEDHTTGRLGNDRNAAASLSLDALDEKSRQETAEKTVEVTTITRKTSNTVLLYEDANGNIVAENNLQRSNSAATTHQTPERGKKANVTTADQTPLPPPHSPPLSGKNLTELLKRARSGSRSPNTTNRASSNHVASRRQHDYDQSPPPQGVASGGSQKASDLTLKDPTTSKSKRSDSVDEDASFFSSPLLSSYSLNGRRPPHTFASGGERGDGKRYQHRAPNATKRGVSVSEDSPKPRAIDGSGENSDADNNNLGFYEEEDEGEEVVVEKEEWVGNELVTTRIITKTRTHHVLDLSPPTPAPSPQKTRSSYAAAVDRSDYAPDGDDRVVTSSSHQWRSKRSSSQIVGARGLTVTRDGEVQIETDEPTFSSYSSSSPFFSALASSRPIKDDYSVQNEKVSVVGEASAVNASGATLSSMDDEDDGNEGSFEEEDFNYFGRGNRKDLEQTEGSETPVTASAPLPPPPPPLHHGGWGGVEANGTRAAASLMMMGRGGIAHDSGDGNNMVFASPDRRRVIVSRAARYNHLNSARDGEDYVDRLGVREQRKYRGADSTECEEDGSFAALSPRHASAGSLFSPGVSGR